MSENRDLSLEAAIELGFLTETNLNEIIQKSKEANLPGLEIAIRKGLLDRRQLEIISAFRSPEEVAPGYRIEGLIGQGGSGVVYMATQLGLDRPVAIKTISSSVLKRNDLASKRFEREAKIIGKLRHPNIVSAVDFGIHSDQLYLVMEFVDGIDGEQYLAEQTAMPEVHAWHVARQVCHALSHAKELDLIHRDIKPANLLLTTPPEGSSVPSQAPFAKIADFGLARFKESSTAKNITLDGAISGTPFYMSPEQIGAKELDHRSDIFSLGASIWHLIVGSPPITGLTPMDIVSARIRLEDDWAEDRPKKLSTSGFDLLREMCRFNPDERISEFAELDSRISTLLKQFEGSKSETMDLSDVGITANLSGSDRANITYIQDLESFRSTQTRANDETDNALPTAPNNANKEVASNVSNDQVAKGATTRISTGWSSGARKWLAAAAIVGLAALSYFVWNRTTQPAANTEHYEQIKLTELAGPPIFLFDGLSVNPRQKFFGTWEVGTGTEKEAILAGNGTRDFKCVDAEGQPLEFFQFQCGFREHESEQIEFRVLGASEQIFFRVEIAKGLCSLKMGDKETSSLPLGNFDEDSFGYHSIHIESQPEHWRIAIDSDSLGVVAKKDLPAVNPETIQTIQLSVTGSGNAHFEEIRFRKFAKDAASN